MKKKFSSIKSNSNNKSNSNIISNSDLSLMSNTNNNNIKILSLPKLPISNISPNILRKKFLCQSISVKSNKEICSELLNKSTMINNNNKLTIKHYKSKSLNNSNNKNNNDLKKIKSELYFYKVPQIVLFHKKLMLKNEKTCLIRFNRELSSENLIIPNKKIKIDNYILNKKLGQGTFGIVVLAIHEITGEKVAIKILDKEKIFQNSEKNRFERKIQIMKKMYHKNIVHLYNVIENFKEIFLVMEYISGQELFDYITNKKRLDELESCKFYQQIISGIEY